MGVPEYLTPLAVWLIVAIVTEWFATRKTHEWSPWLTAISLLTVLFRLYWIVWILTFRNTDLTPVANPATLREKMLIELFLFFASTAFVSVATLAFRRVWVERQKCGRWLMVARILPVTAMAYLFISTLIVALRVVSEIRTSL